MLRLSFFLALTLLLILLNWEVHFIVIFIFISYVLIDFINSIGTKIVYLELVASYAVFTWLLSPLLTYVFFNQNDERASLWETYMPIDSISYFSYTFPATLLFYIGLKFPLYKHPISTKNQIISLTLDLKGKSNIGLFLIILGVIFSVVSRLSFKVLGNLFDNIAFFVYTGLFYVIYSPFKKKAWVVLAVCIIAITQSILTGMFSHIIYLSALGGLLFLANKPISSFLKLAVVFCGVFLILLIQSIKVEYRTETWSGIDRSGNSSLFLSLVEERLTDPSQLFDPERLFAINVRANQGLITAKVLDYVPSHQNYVYGETIAIALAASFIPRVLWPDKPKTGGADMVCRFLGDCESALGGHSYNIGPIGEAYVNFGSVGGIFFMLLYGLFFNFLFNAAQKISLRQPSLILWYPHLFISFLTMETDILSFANAFTKSCFFVYIVFIILSIVRPSYQNVLLKKTNSAP